MNFNEESLKKLLDELFSEDTNEAQLSKKSLKKKFVKDQLEFSKKLEKLANDYNFSTIDVINNVSGTMFSNFCCLVEDETKKRIDPIEMSKTLNANAMKIIKSLDVTLNGESNAVKTMSLIFAVRLFEITDHCDDCNDCDGDSCNNHKETKTEPIKKERTNSEQKEELTKMFKKLIDSMN